MKYVDQYDRIWMKVTSAINKKHWLLLTTVGWQVGDKLQADKYYTDDDLSLAGVDLFEVNRGAQYDLPDPIKVGSQVWVDQDWLFDAGVDSIRNYCGSPARNGGVVVAANEGDPGHVDVTVTIRVPKSKVTKRD